MRKVKCGRALDLLCLFPGAAYSTCLCINNNNNNNSNRNHEEDNMPLIPIHAQKAALKLKDAMAPPTTLAFQLKPKMVVLRVSMHCDGCARRVEKHISKLEGVSSYQIDLETKMVVVRGTLFLSKYWRVFPKSNMLSFGTNETLSYSHFNQKYI